MLPSATNPPLEDEVESGWRSWGATITSEAVSGVTTLARRPEWVAELHDELSAAVIAFLNSPNALYRMLCAQAIPPLFGEEAALEEIEVRLNSETDSQVQSMLVSLLSEYRDACPLKVDEILRRIATEPQWAIIAAGPIGDTKLGDKGSTEIDE